MTFHDGDMSRDEIYGTLLRVETDQLVRLTDELDVDTKFALISAEDLLADIIAARIKQQSTTRE